eukprot:77022-Pelagomonas_calceolata.AAC.1
MPAGIAYVLRSQIWTCNLLARSYLPTIQDNVLFVFYSVPNTFVANSKLARAPISMMQLSFHPKVVTGKA